MIFIYAIYTLYLVLLLLLLVVWLRIEKKKNGEPAELPVSVIVPFRNEANNLSSLVQSLKEQSHTSFEVIFVDDHSEDNGFQVISELLDSVRFQYKVLSLEGEKGKKAAIAFAVVQASHDLVITTDADCTMGSFWLQEMSSRFEDKEIKMLVGPIGLIGDSFWQKMQAIESSALIGVGGAMLQLNRAIMANGANLAYRKEVFYELDGFDGINSTPSGDDELLMAKVAKVYPLGVKFFKATEVMVYTNALSTWGEFRAQRLRWSSKWRVGKRVSTRFTALFVFCIQLVQLALVGALFMQSQYLMITVSLLISKLLIELIFLWSVRRSLGQKMYWLPTGINYLLYPIYAIYFGVAANFGEFEWKGRSYKVNN